MLDVTGQFGLDQNRFGIIPVGFADAVFVAPLQAEENQDIDEDQQQGDDRRLSPIGTAAYGNDDHRLSLWEDGALSDKRETGKDPAGRRKRSGNSPIRAMAEGFHMVVLGFKTHFPLPLSLRLHPCCRQTVETSRGLPLRASYETE
jgi:hypothetical protein